MEIGLSFFSSAEIFPFTHTSFVALSVWMEISRCPPHLPPSCTEHSLKKVQSFKFGHPNAFGLCSAALWEWWLLPFRSIHDNWCLEKFRSRAGLQKPSSKVQFCPCATSWLGGESGFVDVVSLLSHGLVNLTGFRVRGRKGGSDQSGTGTGSHIFLTCKEGMWGGQQRRWQKMAKTPAVSASIRLCAWGSLWYASAAV